MNLEQAKSLEASRQSTAEKLQKEAETLSQEDIIDLQKEFQEQVSEKEINFNEAEYSRKGKKYKYFDCFKDEKYKYFKPIVVKGAKKDYPNGKKNSKKKTGNEKVRGKKKRARNRGPKHR